MTGHPTLDGAPVNNRMDQKRHVQGPLLRALASGGRSAPRTPRLDGAPRERASPPHMRPRALQRVRFSRAASLRIGAARFDGAPPPPDTSSITSVGLREHSIDARHAVQFNEDT